MFNRDSVMKARDAYARAFNDAAALADYAMTTAARMAREDVVKASRALAREEDKAARLLSAHNARTAESAVRVALAR